MTSSLLLDKILLTVFQPLTAYYGMISIRNISFLSLANIFACLFMFTYFKLFKKTINRQIYTLFILVEITFLSILYEFTIINGIGYVLLFLLIVILVIVNIQSNENSDKNIKLKSNRSISSGKYEQVLLKNSFKHSISTSGLLVVMGIEIFIILLICYEFKTGYLVLLFVYILIVIENSNLIVFKKKIADRQNKIDDIITKNIRKAELIILEMIIPILINCFICSIILFVNSINTNTAIALMLAGVNSVFASYLLGKLCDIKYHRQINTVFTVIFMFLTLVLLHFETYLLIVEMIMCIIFLAAIK